MKKANEMRQLPSQEEILSMTGLEFMEKIKLGELPGAPIAKTLNYDLISVSLGQVIFRGAPKFDSMNPVGSVHGGWYGTLLDSAMACAVMKKIPKGSFYTTLEYKINIVKAIPIGMEIDAIGLVTHSGRSTGTADGKIIGTKDKILYATGSTTCLIMQL
ncbi:MAG: PaaI family thioesterase [Rhodobacteraceae bacterium]|nr:PaaI family thioesterase [Paracoccaceae bacterium]